MQLANVWLQLDSLGSNKQLKSINPAEAQVLRKQFGFKSPGTNKVTNPLSHIEILKESDKRNNQEVFDNLCRKYGNALIEKLFPGENPILPNTFKDAGFEETKEKEPEKGEMHEIIPLTKLPKGDKGDKYEPVVNPLAENMLKLEDEILGLKKQLAAKSAIIPANDLAAGPAKTETEDPFKV